MVYDTFPFFIELEILKIRIEELKNIVDCFIISEFPCTYKGLRKKMILNKKDINCENIVILTLDEEKIFKIVGNNYRPNDIEKLQRKIIWDYLKLNANDSDIIIHGDCDEIPDHNIINKYIKDCNNKTMVLMTKIFRYYYNLYFQDWGHLFIGRWDKLKHLTDVDDFRKYKVNNKMKIFNAGWHFSSVGDLDYILKKFKDMNCFGPQKHNKRLGDKERIKNRIKNYLHPFKENKPKGKVVPVTDMPIYIQNNFNYYKHLLLKEN